MSIETISVYLVKAGAATPRDVLRAEIAANVQEHQVAAGETTGTLFVAQGDEHEPDWVRMLQPAANPPISYPRRALSAVLVLRASGRWFALTFGHGRHLLERGVYERDFGLKVALNGVHPEKLRAAQARTFSDYALHTSRQTSRASDIAALEVDVQRDLLTSLAGVLTDPAVGDRIDGRDAARLTAELDVSLLAPKCAELLALSRKTAYRKVFPGSTGSRRSVTLTSSSPSKGGRSRHSGRESSASSTCIRPSLCRTKSSSSRTGPGSGAR